MEAWWPESERENLRPTDKSGLSLQRHHLGPEEVTRRRSEALVSSKAAAGNVSS